MCHTCACGSVDALYTCTYSVPTCTMYMYIVHGKYVYSTLALEKEREIVKEETALRKEKEAVCTCICMHHQPVYNVHARPAQLFL